MPPMRRDALFPQFPTRILGRRYPLTKTAYKYVDISIIVGRPSFVSIALGDNGLGNHGKEVSLTPQMWKELLDQRHIILPYVRHDERNDDDDDARTPHPLYIGHLMVRFGKINNLRILQFETPKIRLAHN